MRRERRLEAVRFAAEHARIGKLQLQRFENGGALFVADVARRFSCRRLRVGPASDCRCSSSENDRSRKKVRCRSCHGQRRRQLQPRTAKAIEQSVQRPTRGIQNRRSVVMQDRKSTRLNSSHLVISYAVFCLKKKFNK